MAKKRKKQASDNPAELSWNASQSSSALLLELQILAVGGRSDLSDRKFRLLIVSCARRIDSLFPNDHCRRYVALAEAFADGLIPIDEFRAVYDTSQEEAFQGAEDATDQPYNEAWSRYAAANVAQWLLLPNPGRTIVPEMKSAAGWWAADALADRRLLNNPATIPESRRLLAAAEEEQVRLIHDIFGNPFRPVIFSPAWRTDTAVTLARGMYESRDFGAMPILADALQDAGCDNTDILTHCRDANQTHVRGCWVVDLVLGKQ